MGYKGGKGKSELKGKVSYKEKVNKEKGKSELKGKGE